MSTLFVISEVWIVAFAGDAHRGKVVAIYGAVLAGSFGAGPAMIGWVGIDGWTPFVLGALVVGLAILPMLWIKEPKDEGVDHDKGKTDHGQTDQTDQTDQTEETGERRSLSFFGFAYKAPMLLMCVMAFSIFDAATLSLLPVYGLQHGYDLAVSANMLTALILGNTVLQLPLGWLADKYPHRRLLMGCALLTTVMLLLLPLAIGTIWIWPIFIVMGTFGYGVYTVSLTALGDRFNGDELVSGSAAFATMWGCGALLGSVSGGWSMAAFGSEGLPIHLALVYGLLVIGLLVRATAAGGKNGS